VKQNKNQMVLFIAALMFRYRDIVL